MSLLTKPQFAVLFESLIDLQSAAGREAAITIGATLVESMGGDEYERVFNDVNEALASVAGVGPMVVAMALGSQAKDVEHVRMLALALAAHYRGMKETQ